MNRSLLPTILAFLASAAMSLAAPGDFKPSQTSAEAKWFAHINFVSLRASEIGQKLIRELDGEARRQLRQFEKMLNFHPVEDLESATFYGATADPEKAVALIRGPFDSERLVKAASDGDNYRMFTHDKTQVHSWTDNGNRIYATIRDEKLIIISPELELLLTAEQVVAGKSPALDASELFGHIRTSHAPIVIASADLAALGTLEIDSSLVRKLKSIYITAGEKDGEMLAFAALQTADGRSAELVDKMLNGVLALAEASDEIPPEIIEAFKTSLSEKGISLTVSLPVKKFKSLVAKLEKAAGGLK